mgnify:CR=1
DVSLRCQVLLSGSILIFVNRLVRPFRSARPAVLKRLASPFSYRFGRLVPTPSEITFSTSTVLLRTVEMTPSVRGE